MAEYHMNGRRLKVSLTRKVLLYIVGGMKLLDIVVFIFVGELLNIKVENWSDLSIKFSLIMDQVIIELLCVTIYTCFFVALVYIMF